MKILNEDYSTKEKLAIIDDFEEKFREATTSLGGDFDDYRAQVTPQTAIFVFVTYVRRRRNYAYNQFKEELINKLTEVMKNSEYSDISRIDINEVDYAPEGFKGYEVYIKSYTETEGF